MHTILPSRILHKEVRCFPSCHCVIEAQLVTRVRKKRQGSGGSAIRHCCVKGGCEGIAFDSVGCLPCLVAGSAATLMSLSISNLIGSQAICSGSI